MANELNTHFLFRTCVNRGSGANGRAVADEMANAKANGLHRIQVRCNSGRTVQVTLELKYRRVKILPPVGKQKRYPPLMVTVIHAKERGTPLDRDRVNWKLVTNLKIGSRNDAIEKLQWYAHRWKIETFFKILKSGCKAEESKLRTAERLVNLLAIYCILSWRIFWMTMLRRYSLRLAPDFALTTVEIKIRDRVAGRKTQSRRKMALSTYLNGIACLGGYLNRKHDPPPAISSSGADWRA